MARRHEQKEHPIPELMSIREAARRLEKDPYFVRGIILGMGIDLVSAPPSLLISRQDFERLRDRLGSQEPATASSTA